MGMIHKTITNWLLCLKHQDDNKQYQLQEEKFENLFGGWEIGLTEAVEKEKGKSAIIKYDKYEINGGQLIFNLIDCEKKSIDELMPPTRFVVESQAKKELFIRR